MRACVTTYVRHTGVVCVLPHLFPSFQFKCQCWAFQGTIKTAGHGEAAEAAVVVGAIVLLAVLNTRPWLCCISSLTGLRLRKLTLRRCSSHL